MFKILIICIVLFSIVNAFLHSTNKVMKINGFKLNLFGNPEPPKANNQEKKDGGLFGGMGNLMESMKKAQEIAKQAESVNKELANTIIIGQDPSGAVTTTFNGLGVPIGIKISESILSEGSEAVSLAATKALADGHAKSQNTMMVRMTELYSGAGIPLPGKM